MREIMNKTIILTIFLVAVFLNVSAVSAWDWNTHEEIIESNYHSLPADMQQNLDLKIMKKGSLAPDFIFFDFKYHSYPNSYQKSIYWLNKGQYYYGKGDFYYASYCYGVASHYIADSFSAPHAAGVGGIQHVIYEAKASFLKPKMVQVKGNLNSTMYNGDLNDQKSWKIWIKTKNDSLIQEDLNQATGTSYNAIYSSIKDAHTIPKSDSDEDVKLKFLIPLLNSF
jgi:hypothetical protein